MSETGSSNQLLAEEHQIPVLILLDFNSADNNINRNNARLILVL